MYELPPILSGSAESQLRALRDYLVRLSQTLPTETTQPAAAQTGAVSPQLAAARAVDSNPTGSGQVTPSNYPRLRALIEKTAGEIYSHVDAINRQLRADYVARSELGEFEERVTADMEADGARRSRRGLWARCSGRRRRRTPPRSSDSAHGAA